MFRNLIASLILFCISLLANAQDGNSFKNIITSNNPTGKALGNGYLIGFIQGQPNTLCVPQTASQEQIVSVVLKYFENHPETLHHHQASLIFNALNEAWPCASKKK
jgi:hypothetical protein